MDKKENLTLEEIKKDIKRILELLENPKREINNEKSSNKDSNEATDKQLFFLKKAGIEIKEGLTKAEAFQLIKGIKEKPMEKKEIFKEEFEDY